MNKVLFTCKYFKVRVREVLLVLLVLVLLFFGLKACQNHELEKEKEKKKEEKIENICSFTNENIHAFDQLMSRVDLCSEGWFKDFDDYITRIEDQNIYLKKKDKKEYQSVWKHQKAFLKDLKAFKEKQKDKDIEKLETTFKAYKKYYEGACRKGK